MNWLYYFEQNRARRIPIPWDEGGTLEEHLRAPLIRSLQRFQLGEQGDGRYLRRAAAHTGDRDYAAAVALFIEEEQVHAQLLARLLKSLGAPLLRRHWSDLCFVLVRRLAGLRLELVVLLTAEIIARRYYRTIYEATRDRVLSLVCAQILYDEVGHVDFHCEYLRHAFARTSRMRRRLSLRLWRVFFRGVCAVVTYDHRSLLQAAGVSQASFRHDCRQLFEEAALRIFTPEGTNSRHAISG